MHWLEYCPVIRGSGNRVVRSTVPTDEGYPPLAPSDMAVGQLALQRVELSTGVEAVRLQDVQVHTLVTWSRHCPVVCKR